MRECRGFTLMELIAVIVIAGILAVFASSGFSRRGIEAATYRERIQATVAYAQRMALANRRAVRVAVAGNALTLSVCSAGVGTTVCDVAWNDLPAPTGEASLAAPAAVALSLNGLSTATFYFDSSGRPVDVNGAAVAAQSLTATGDQGYAVTVEAETGYVRRI